MTAIITPPIKIDISQLEHLLTIKPDTRILDLRSGDEFAAAHIPGSANVVGASITSEIQAANPVVLICQTGARATQLQNDLFRKGYRAPLVLDGGIGLWEKAGKPLTRTSKKRWVMERQIRLVAGSLVLLGLIVSIVVPEAKWFAGLIGSGLVFSAVSNTCFMARVLEKLPYNQNAA